MAKRCKHAEEQIVKGGIKYDYPKGKFVEKRDRKILGCKLASVTDPTMDLCVNPLGGGCQKYEPEE